LEGRLVLVQNVFLCTQPAFRRKPFDKAQDREEERKAEEPFDDAQGRKSS